MSATDTPGAPRNGAPATAKRKPTVAEIAFLMTFHAVISGGFFVAYLTGDEDTYRMHVVAGYAVLGAVIARLLAGLAAVADSPLRLPRPALESTLAWLARVAIWDPRARQARSPLYAWMAVALLAGVGLAAGSGAISDYLPSLDGVHEALANLALGIALGHVAIVMLLHLVRRSVAPSPEPAGVTVKRKAAALP